MKIKLVALVFVLAALLVPASSWAVFQSCEACPRLGPAAQCTCPGGPPFIFTICSNYPRGCQLNFVRSTSASGSSGRDAFLASLASAPAAPQPAPAR